MSRWNTVAIFGVGLIGGSIGIALRQRELADEVIGIGRDAARLTKAVDLGALHRFTVDVADGVHRAEVVIVCTPVQLVPAHIQQVAQYCDSRAVITDAGSTKERLVASVEAQLPQANFVGSHPLAGSDRSGVQFSDADLFVNRTVVVTPTETTPAVATQTACELWQALGAHVISMTPAEHDQAVALTSHLPHIVASALAAETPDQYLRLVAGGWLDTTRVAAGDAELWKQILATNQTNIVTALRSFRARLEHFETALVEQDHESLTRQLAVGKQRRDAVGS